MIKTVIEGSLYSQNHLKNGVTHKMLGLYVVGDEIGYHPRTRGVRHKRGEVIR